MLLEKCLVYRTEINLFLYDELLTHGIQMSLGTGLVLIHVMEY